MEKADHSHFAGNSRAIENITYNGDIVENNHTYRGECPGMEV
ncbi:hypothetical protein [Evansella sp. LMS18]|jgi:hypothetical protein|nr:hypothetical protein [Evansella sp. LMS18]